MVDPYATLLPMLTLTITPSEATFHGASGVAGVYHYRDSYKPFIHPLKTPLGRCVTLASPHDHKHHKGLMYALRARDVNFWEEWSTQNRESVGVINHLAFADVVANGTRVGFLEQLQWCAEDGSMASFEERRSIHLRIDTRGSYIWCWRTRLTALRDMELIHSQWANKHPDGRCTNYHGLGIRLIREFGGATGNHRMLLDGVETSPDEAMGARPREVRYEGSFDGIWPVARAAVTLSQNHGYTLYTMMEYIAWMSMGPTNHEPMRVTAGQTWEEKYAIRIEDLLHTGP